MTDWKDQTAEELICQLKNEVERISNLPMGHNYDKMIYISRNLYEKLKDV
jgi:hypothetical protein